MKGSPLLLLLSLAPLRSVRGQATLQVPGAYPTIQSAIVAAANGDTVLVAPGTYVGVVDFLGKGITVRSSGGPLVTVIDGNGLPVPVVKFASGEPASAILSGFTVRNGAASGIRIDNGAAPTIVGNRIEENHACSGCGILVQASSPRIVGNRIANNSVLGCSGSEGGGLYLQGGCSGAQILDNEIVGNMNSNGGGIALSAAGSPLIRGNFIGANIAFAYSGGIGWANSSPRLIQNFFFGNTAFAAGAAIAMSSPTVVPPAQILNNTVVANNGVNGSALYATGLDFAILIENNLFVGPAGSTAVYSPVYTTATVFKNNDVYCPGGTAYGGGMPSLTGTNGNISADPLFLNASLGDFHLLPSSPCVDAGFSAVPSPPPTDPDGDARIYDGDGNGSAEVDIGWDEFSPASRFGSGCAGSLGLLPRIGLSGQAPALGNAPAVLLSNAPPGVLAVLVLSTVTAAPPGSLAGLGLPSCFLLLIPGVLLPGTTSGTGIGSGSVATSLPIPVDPALHGLHLFFQAYASDAPGSPLPGGLSVALDMLIP